jgi:hypothetical protein
MTSIGCRRQTGMMDTWPSEKQTTDQADQAISASPGLSCVPSRHMEIVLEAPPHLLRRCPPALTHPMRVMRRISRAESS